MQRSSGLPSVQLRVSTAVTAAAVVTDRPVVAATISQLCTMYDLYRTGTCGIQQHNQKKQITNRSCSPRKIDVFIFGDEFREPRRLSPSLSRK